MNGDQSICAREFHARFEAVLHRSEQAIQQKRDRDGSDGEGAAEFAAIQIRQNERHESDHDLQYAPFRAARVAIQEVSRMRLILIALLSLVLAPLGLAAEGGVDRTTLNRIADEGFNHSELPQTAEY